MPGCLGAMRRTVSMRGPAAGCVALRVAPADKALRPALQSKMADLWSARAGDGLRDESADACGGRRNCLPMAWASGL